MATKSDTVKVRTTGWLGDRGPGTELELTEREARQMVRKGQAKYADDPDAPAKRDWPAYTEATKADDTSSDGGDSTPADKPAAKKPTSSSKS